MQNAPDAQSRVRQSYTLCEIFIAVTRKVTSLHPLDQGYAIVNSCQIY